MEEGEAYRTPSAYQRTSKNPLLCRILKPRSRCAGQGGNEERGLEPTKALSYYTAFPLFKCHLSQNFAQLDRSTVGNSFSFIASLKSFIHSGSNHIGIVRSGNLVLHLLRRYFFCGKVKLFPALPFISSDII